MLEQKLSKAEQKAAEAREKYAAMTISEILAGIITRMLIFMMITLVAVILLYLSPISERLLSTVLLFFVLVEMEIEYGLWFFTYRLGRKTEGPMIDLQAFSTLTKEGWRRAEIVLDLTTPIFKWLEETRERIWPDWRNKKSEEIKPVTAADLVKGLEAIAVSIDDLNKRMAKMETKEVKWGTKGLDKD